MTTPRAGLWIASASVLVSAPRMVLAILAADRISPPAAVEAVLLVLSAVGAVAVLGWGNLYLVHVISSTERRRALLSAFAVVQLLAMLALLLPLLLSGLEARPLHAVLESARLRLAWSVVTIAAPELLAVACVIASASLGGSSAPPVARERRSPAIVGLGLSSASIAPPAPLRGWPATPSAPAGEQDGPTLCRQGCGRTLPTLRAERAHLRHCPRAQAAAAQQ